MASYRPPHFMGRNHRQTVHKRLVQNSVVLSLQEPPLEKLSDFIMSCIPHNSRNVHFSQNGYRGSSGRPGHCDKCGNYHRDFRLCKALTRICYICRRYGHYANFCTISVDTRSERKQPFVDEDSDCESEDSFCSVDTTPCPNEADVLELNMERVSIQNDSLVEEVITLKNQCQVLQDQNKKLSAEVTKLETSLHDAEQKLSRSESETRSVFQYSVKLMKACVEFDHLVHHLQQEFDLMAGLTTMSADGIQDEDPCEKCATVHGDHGEDSCPVDMPNCFRCGESKHLAAVCDRDKLPETEPDEETHKILLDLEQMTGQTLCKSINCLQCDDDVAAFVDGHCDQFCTDDCDGPGLWEPKTLIWMIESVVKQVLD